MFEAKLFPILHATDSIGLVDLLWIQGVVPDEDHTMLKRLISILFSSLFFVKKIISGGFECSYLPFGIPANFKRFFA